MIIEKCYMYWLRSSMDLERLSSEQKVAGSSPAEAVLERDEGLRMRDE